MRMRKKSERDIRATVQFKKFPMWVWTRTKINDLHLRGNQNTDSLVVLVENFFLSLSLTNCSVQRYHNDTSTI